MLKIVLAKTMARFELIGMQLLVTLRANSEVARVGQTTAAALS